MTEVTAAERPAAGTAIGAWDQAEAGSSARMTPGSEYAELKRRIKAEGLLEKQPLYYGVNIAFVLTLFGICVATLVMVDSLWLQLINAVVLAFTFTQISFLGHDATHRQIFRSTHFNNVAGTMFWNVLLGMSNRWFIYRHNRHHAMPNEIDRDPDADLMLLSLSDEQARGRGSIMQFFVKRQVVLLPILSLEMIILHYASYMYLRSGKRPLIEPVLTVASIMAFVALPFYFLGFWPAMLFLLVNQLFFGLYFASVIASNHKGMPMWDPSSSPDFLRQQVLTARNVASSPLTDFWYGGLNFQIEHHLFPNMPRNKLRDAQVIVKQFCREHDIAYEETSLLQSFGDVLTTLRAVSARARLEAVAA